jgi:hypothetical protein
MDMVRVRAVWSLGIYYLLVQVKNVPSTGFVALADKSNCPGGRIAPIRHRVS